jgi:hypothetical protein
VRSAPSGVSSSRSGVRLQEEDHLRPGVVLSGIELRQYLAEPLKHRAFPHLYKFLLTLIIFPISPRLNEFAGAAFALLGR